MLKDETQSNEEVELRTAIERVLSSTSGKKLVIAGPGTGKTTLFKQLLELAPGDADQRIVLTFINNLRDNLEIDLGGLAKVFTLHSYCLRLLHRNPSLRSLLSPNFRVCPELAHIIIEDWKLINQDDTPKFIGEMRALSEENQIPFYLARGEYYDAVDFDDSVYRVYQGLSLNLLVPESYDLVLIDEYQDFNALEAGVIAILADHSPIVIAGDDDQALYSKLRDASWDHIRLLNKTGEYEVFELPYCMRCPEVVVDAVNDVFYKAEELKNLEGRIKKPYKYFPPVKASDSANYPKIDHVTTSVQRKSANYMGRYLAQAISQIPKDEIETSARSGYPAALIIVAEPYRSQIVSHLEDKGFIINTKRNLKSKLSREVGLSILKEDQTSNLGWRIFLDEDAPSFLRDVIVATVSGARSIVDLLPIDYRQRILAEVKKYEPVEEEKAEEEVLVSEEHPIIIVTSFEGAKGLSAQHVYIVGLHNGELPHDMASIKDLEICKFVVALSRTRKKCTLMNTLRFADKWKTPSSFISWIDPKRLEPVKVDKQYWKQQIKD